MHLRDPILTQRCNKFRLWVPKSISTWMNNEPFHDISYWMYFRFVFKHWYPFPRSKVILGLYCIIIFQCACLTFDKRFQRIDRTMIIITSSYSFMRINFTRGGDETIAKKSFNLFMVKMFVPIALCPCM